MNPPEYPTPWQRKAIWAALTALSIAAIFVVVVGFIYLFSQGMSFLQPILVPFAVAGVMGYLLEPAVVQMMRWGTTRDRAVWAVFGITTLILVTMFIWIIPSVATQSSRLAGKIPEMSHVLHNRLSDVARDVREKWGVQVVPDELLTKSARKKPEEKVPDQEKPAGDPTGKTSPEAPPETTIPSPTADQPDSAIAAKEKPETTLDAITGSKVDDKVEEKPSEKSKITATPSVVSARDSVLFHDLLTGDWVSTTLPTIFRGTLNFFGSSVGGFLGIFGFLLSLVIVPLYLFYFLTESHHISSGWSKYLPLKASHFKDEVVATLTEINGYLIAFFRGQLVVSLINGTATAVGLMFIGLDFGILIGLALCFLGIIPYIGIVLCWVPAVIIASVQGGSWLIPADASWWVFPAAVTGVFAVVQQVDGLFVTPKIVGERVGLHPMTVIFSVFLWSLLLGGLLGAILAVPLSATVKVLLKRYVWERTIMAEPAAAAPPPDLPPDGQ